MSKHTKGEWDISFTQNDLNEEESGTINVYSIKDNQQICSISNELFIEEAEANSKLISASPDLLESAENAIIEASASFNFDEKNYPEWMKKIQEAIKKATE